MIPTAEENPNGLHQRYKVTKADGTTCDPNAVYFVLRLDSGGSIGHIASCREAAVAYAAASQHYPDLKDVGIELLRLVHKLETA